MNLSNDFLRKNGPEVHALFTGGLPGFLLPGRARPLSGGVPVFCYHTVELELFEQDMLFLRDNGYQTMGADDLLDYILGKRDVSERTVVLSFDDGALNFYRTAFPLLCEHGQRAVLFIAPGLHRERREEGAGKRRPCSWEELDEMHGSGCVDLQSHTWVHRSLTDWPTPLPLAGIDAEVVGDRLGEELSMEDDLRRAREYIEARFGKRVRHLA